MKKYLLKTYSLGLSILFLAQFSFGQLNITPASAPNTCDGSAALSNQSTIIQSSVMWYGNGALIATNTYQIGNLCPGNYNVYYNQNNSAGGIDSLNATFTILNGAANPCANFSATLTTTPCSSANSNDGSIFSTVTGGTPPYIYIWSTAEVTQNIINLIPGYNYCLYVVDSNNGCQTLVCDSMTIFGVNTGDTLVVNNANCGATSIGNFVQQFEDCNFNFSACTSASLTSSMPIGSDTIQTIWTFVDSNNLAIGTYTIYYFIPNGMANGCLNLQFILYCSTKSMNVKTIVVNDMVQVSGLNEVLKNPFTVINPMGDELNVQFDEETSGIIKLFDMNGQIVKTQTLHSVQKVAIPTMNLSSGMYFLQLEVDSIVYTQKVIK